MSNENASYINGVINVSYTYAAEVNNTEVVKKERTLSNMINIPLVNNVAGLTITKQAPSSAANNEVFAYTITVANNTEAVQSNLSITDHLPDMFNVLENMIVVQNGNIVLQNGIDYTANIDNGILTIAGMSNNDFQLNAGQELTVQISGYVSF